MAKLNTVFEVESMAQAKEILEALKKNYSVVSAELSVDLLSAPSSAPQTQTPPAKSESKPVPQETKPQTQAQVQVQAQPESKPQPQPTASTPEGDEPTFGKGPKVFVKDGKEMQMANLKPSELADGWVGTDGVSGMDFMKKVLPGMKNMLSDPNTDSSLRDFYAKLVPWIEKAVA